MGDTKDNKENSSGKNNSNTLNDNFTTTRESNLGDKSNLINKQKMNCFSCADCGSYVTET